MRSPHIDWSRAALRCRRDPTAAAVVNSLSDAFDAVASAWPADPPLGQTEWSHHYFCDEDAAALRFDLSEPNRHVCPRCGRVYAGEPWDGAWRSNVHGTLVGACERATVLGMLRPHDERYRHFVRRVVLFYANHYADYAVHGVRAGKGKVMSQSLDEAIVVLSIGRYVEWTRQAGWFNDAEMSLLRQKLFAPAAELLRPQVKVIHNIHQWMNSALATCARFLDDRALLDWSIAAATGFHAQMAHGVNGDGMWFEGSITYHLYTFNAFASHALTALDMGVDLFDEPRFARMLLAPLDLVYPDGQFPAHNDCWPGVRLPANLYEFGAWAWPGTRLADELGRVVQLAGPERQTAHWTATLDRQPAAPTGQARASVHALLWGPEQLAPAKPSAGRASRTLPASGVAILEHERLDLRLCLRAGPFAGMHDHYDKLAVDVFADGQVLSPDLGTSGYGAKVTGQWYRTAAAHNLVCVDGRRQGKSSARIVTCDATRVVARAEEAYAGVLLERSLTLLPDGWLDVFEIAAEREVRCDYFFHARGSVSLDVPVQAESLGEGDGYAWPRDVRQAVGPLTVPPRATWASGITLLTAQTQSCEGLEVFVAQTDDNPAAPDRPLGLLVLRRRGRVVRFEVRYTQSAAPQK
jgi:hypothetical protein